jgi:predicted transcriptional regulator
LGRYLGALEAEIMAVLWSLPEASVREVTERLNRRRPHRALAYTTVMTVMSRLADKRMLSRRLQGKTYEYHAAFSQGGFLEQLSSERVSAVLSEFGELAVTQFLGHLERLDPEHLRRLIELVAEQRERKEP